MDIVLGPTPWSLSPAELRALYALAVEHVTPQAPEAKTFVDWLLAHRTGHRWTPDKATGPAAMALGQWFAQSRFEGEHYRLAVFVNDVQAKVLDIDEAAGTQVIDVPASYLAPGDSPGVKLGKQRITFQLTGRGRYTYQCILGGFVPADKLLKKSHGIEIQLDQRALDDVGIPADTPITRSLRGISLRSALQLLLRDLDLTHLIRDEVLLITTEEEAEVMLATVAYPVTDLVRFRDKSGEEWADFDSLIETITSTVAQLLEKMRSLAGRKEDHDKPPLREQSELPYTGHGMFGGMGGMGGVRAGGIF